MMVNFRPIQMFVLGELREFLLLEHRKHFEQSHGVLIGNLKSEQWMGGNEWKPNYLCFDDFGFVAEISRFVDDLAKWDHAIDEIRSQYFYEKTTNELPEKYLFVFGFNSPVVEELEYLRSRCKTIVKGIEVITAEEPKIAKTITKQDIAKRIGKRDSAINEHMKKGLNPINPGKKPLVFDYNHAVDFYRKLGIDLQ